MNLGDFPEGLQGIYVDIDAFFDTRLATLEYIDRDLALKNLREGWLSRETDVPKYVPLEPYQGIYGLRDTSILELASPSNIHIAMLDWITQAKTAAIVSPRPVHVQLFVNFWPYKLPLDVAKELADIIYVRLKKNVPITIINVPPEQLTFATCKRYFSCMYKYDWREWLETIAKSGEIKHIQVPDVTLYVPKVYPDRLPNQEEMNRVKETGRDLFSEIEMITGRVIGLEFLDVQFYSSSLPTNTDDLVKAADAMLKENSMSQDPNTPADNTAS